MRNKNNLLTDCFYYYLNEKTTLMLVQGKNELIYHLKSQLDLSFYLFKGQFIITVTHRKIF